MGDEHGGTPPPASTPIALNDAHASQAAKELQMATGADLEAFLNSIDFNKMPKPDAATNVSAALPTEGSSDRKRNRGTRGAARGASIAYDQWSTTDGESDHGATANAAMANTNAPPAHKKLPPVDETATKTEAPLMPPSAKANKAAAKAKATPAPTKPLAEDVSAKDTETRAAPTKTLPANAAAADGADPRKKPRGEYNGTRAASKKGQHGRRAEEPGNSHDQPEQAAAPANANPWTKARAVLLRQKVGTKAAETEQADVIQYKQYYEIATSRHYRVIPDGFPRRSITEVEILTLYLWRAKEIHLAAPPRFTTETHTLRERLAFAQIQRTLLTYCLNIDTPGQLRMPAETAKYHFYTQLLAKNQNVDGPTDAVVDLMTDVHSIAVSASSRRAILKFVRPELRDKWEGTVLPFPFGAVTLRAASYFEQENKKNGLDQDTVTLLYTYSFIGKPNLSLEEVHAMATSISGGIPILNIEPIEPTGDKTLDPHLWKVTLNSIDAPPGIEKVRELTVQKGESSFTIGLHQPRLASRQPCSVCLQTTHFRNKCPNKANASDVRTPFMMHIAIPRATETEFEPVATNLDGFRAQMERMRAQLEPHLAQAADAPEAPPRAGETEEAAMPSTSPIGVKGKPRKRSMKVKTKTAQLNIIIGASKTDTRAGKRCTPAEPAVATACGATDTALAGTRSASKSTPKANSPRTRFPADMPTPGEKRTWAEYDNATKPSGTRLNGNEKSNGAKTHPPTRQARTELTHDKIDSSRPDTARRRNGLSVVAHVRPLGNKPLTGQLSMTPFLPTAPRDETPSPDVQIVGHQPAAQQPAKIDTLLEAVRMKEVNTPGNGSCLKYALVVVQAAECGDEVTVDMPQDVSNAKRVGKTISNRLSKRVGGMIRDGTLNKTTLCSTVLGRVVEPDSIQQLQAHFREAARQPCDVPIPRKYWAGEPEIKTFVEWIGETVYAIDVMPNGDAFPQWYRLVDIRRPDGKTVRRAIVSAVTEASFRAHMVVYMRNHVIPLVILLHHTTGGGQAVGHFTAARVSNATYRHWAGTKRQQGDMQERLVKVSRELRSMDREMTYFATPMASPAATAGEGSVYEPSGHEAAEDHPMDSKDGQPVSEADAQSSRSEETAEGATASAEDTPMGDASVDAGSTAEYSTRDAEAAPNFSLLTRQDDQADALHGTYLPDSVNSILSTASLPDFSPATLRHFLPATHTSQPPMPVGYQEDELIMRLSARPPYSDEMDRMIKRVYASNITVFEAWKARQRRDNPDTYEAIRQGPIRASEALQEDIVAFIELVHALPYPEVHVATLSDGVLVSAGQAAICLGNTQLIHRVQGSLSRSSQTFCSTWLEALTATETPTNARWSLSQAHERWERLERAAAQKQVQLPQRTRHGIGEVAWCKLLAYLLLVPGSIPGSYTARPVPQRCDALLFWLKSLDNEDLVVRSAQAIDERQWLATRDVFPAPSADAASNATASSSHGLLAEAEAAPCN